MALRAGTTTMASKAPYTGAVFWATRWAGLPSSPMSVVVVRHSLGKRTPSVPFVSGQFVGQAQTRVSHLPNPSSKVTLIKERNVDPQSPSLSLAFGLLSWNSGLCASAYSVLPLKGYSSLPSQCPHSLGQMSPSSCSCLQYTQVEASHPRPRQHRPPMA